MKASVHLFRNRGMTSGLVLDLQAHHENPQGIREVLDIANNYTLAKEVTLDNRESKKDKELGQSD
jgi:hypothetical protein